MTARSLRPITLTPDMADPEEILAAVVRGDAAGIAEVYRVHAGSMLHLAERLLGSRADAEDAVHDVFVALPGLLGGLEHPDRLEGWLRGVTARVAIDRIKRDRRRRRLLDAGAASGDLGEAIAARPSPEAGIDLDRALRRLHAALRIVFVLRHSEGHSYERIGELLDISPGAARTRYARALGSLRQLMEVRQ